MLPVSYVCVAGLILIRKFVERRHLCFAARRLNSVLSASTFALVFSSTMFIRWVVFLSVVYVVCEGKPASQCGHDEFQCHDGSCVDKFRWCDSTADCDDDSDEMYCFTKSGLVENPNRCNLTSFFLCKDGPCIPLTGRCDGFRSCKDNSDEEDCGTENYVDTFTHLSTTRRPEMVEDLPTTSNHINHSEKALESSVLPRANSTASQNLSGDVAQAPTYQNGISHITTSKSANLQDNLQETSSAEPFTSRDMGSQFVELHDDILQDNVSENMKPSDASLPGLGKHEVVLKRVDLHENILEISTISSDANHNLDLKHVGILSVQADSSAPKNVSSTEEDLKRGFIELKLRDFARQRADAQHWLLNSRDGDYGWGDETPRALIALYMSDDGSLKKNSNEKLLMSKQLHLKLFTALIRNQTKPMSLGELSLYINALAASCDNPENFHGQDLVNTLRHRTNAAQGSSKFVAPIVYLTLCLNNATTYADVRKVQEMLFGNKIDKIDIKALVSLTATCISRCPKFSSTGVGQHIEKNLYRKIISEGLPENIYELALVSQALNEARINQDLWNRSEAMHFISSSQQSNGSFGDILSTYYVVPILAGRSLVSLGQHCHYGEDKGLIPLDVLKNGKDEKMHVRYSLYFGKPVEVTQSLMIKVQKSTNFLDIMRIAEEINPVYKFRYDTSRGKPTVYSIGGVVNDAEQGLYWTLHVSSRQNSTENLLPYKGDIRSYVPSPEENIVFWMKSIFKA